MGSNAAVQGHGEGGTVAFRKLVPRPRGQTATFGRYEWLYNPNGLHYSTRREIDKYTAEGRGPISVIQWPSGEVIYANGKWKDDDQVPIEEEPKHAKGRGRT